MRTNERNRITKETEFVKEMGHAGDMSQDAIKSMNEYIRCFNEASSLDEVASVCERRKNELLAQSIKQMDEDYHSKKASLDDFIEYEG